MKLIKRMFSKLVFTVLVSIVCTVFALVVFCQQSSEIAEYRDGSHVILAGSVSRPVPYGTNPNRYLYTLHDLTGEVYVLTYAGKPSNRSLMIIRGIKSTVNGHLVIQEHKRLHSDYATWLRRFRRLAGGITAGVRHWIDEGFVEP